MSVQKSVSKQIGAHLGDAASTFEVGTTDWGSVRRGLVRARRRRRAAAAGRVVVGMLAVAAVAVAGLRTC